MTTNFFRSVFVALLIPFTFACTGLTIFVGNSADMPGTIPALLPLLCGLVGAVTLGLFLVQLPFLFIKKNWFVTVNALLLGCGFLLWLQANVFNWNFGELDGSGINWAAFRHLMALEIVVYVAVIGLVVWRRQLLYGYAIHLACLLMFMQAVPLVKPVAMDLLPAWIQQSVDEEPSIKPTDQQPTEPVKKSKRTPSWKKYEITFNGFFDYSPEQNVVLIITDAFSTELFQRMAMKHPEVMEWFSDFNCFLKQKSQGQTTVSIPQILTAADDSFVPILLARDNTENKYNDTLSMLWHSQGALQKTLAEAGFQTRLFVSAAPSRYYWDDRWIFNIRPEGTPDPLRKRTRWDDLNESGIGRVVDLTIVRSLPLICKPADIEQFSPLDSFFQHRLVWELSVFAPIPKKDDTLFVQVMTENAHTTKAEKPVLNVIHLQGVHRPYIFNENFEIEDLSGIGGDERQAFAILLLLKHLIDDMKEADVYDNALFIIAGDHGAPVPGVSYISDKAQFYNPLLLVKRRNERHDGIVYRTEYTNVRDITPTILDLVGLPNPPGRFSIFDMPADVLAQREVEYEAFWARQRKDLKLQNVILDKRGGEMDNPVSSEIALKRSELYVHNGRLRLCVGDNPDVWNENRSKQQSIIVMTPIRRERGESVSYQGTALLYDRSVKHNVPYWLCTATLDIRNVADGEYTVEFLLPKEDGTYARNVLPDTVTVAAGVASVPSAVAPVAAKTSTVQ